MTKKQQPTLAERVLEASLSVDRSALAGALGRLVAKRQRRTVAAIDEFTKADISDLVARAKADALEAISTTFTRKRRTRTTRRAAMFKVVNSHLTSAAGSGLRRGTKRWNKLRFVLERIQQNRDNGVSTYVSTLIGSTFDESGDTLDMHDLNGMVDRHHITIGD